MSAKKEALAAVLLPPVVFEKGASTPAAQPRAPRPPASRRPISGTRQFRSTGPQSIALCDRCEQKAV